ncbi:MAG: Stp1/IreP family PP2C-type Ser/Thr phosphatase [Thermoleophilia bacterium]|nr:Stp1/IreP family PP2C-type Ser/Thr phosphatase [Gaiellaceae bacterium]MDW8338001.1 Stp1/IreP family PP2C-type Ser/Thr phosphatase [Thermoleophilia bacterium]
MTRGSIRLGRAVGITDTGRRRLRNEDAFVCEPPLFAVADGMGGARAGEIAARLAAATLEEGLAEIRDSETLAARIAEANRRIWERSLTDPVTAGMGTTMTAALVDEATATVTIAHVGDSRAYLLRDGGLEQLTVDHSLVAELVESGLLTPEEAERHPQRSTITRALGTEPTVEVDVRTIEARPGDLFLLCSDGLPIMVDDAEVLAILDRAEREPAVAAEALVAAANARGGEDNVTVVLFELVEDDAPSQEERPAAPPTRQVEPELGPSPTVAAIAPAQLASPAAPPPAALTRHGAGPGGRGAALTAIVALVVIAALLLYWSLGR